VKIQKRLVNKFKYVVRALKFDMYRVPNGKREEKKIIRRKKVRMPIGTEVKAQSVQCHERNNS
jgi:hypothetical protein